MRKIGVTLLSVVFIAVAFSVGSPAAGYRDGVYRGVSRISVYGQAIVEVTIAEGKITDIEFLRIPDWYPGRVKKELESEIVKKQSPRVDAVTGATLSSELIVEAVSAALKKAGGSGDDIGSVQEHRLPAGKSSGVD